MKTRYLTEVLISERRQKEIRVLCDLQEQSRTGLVAYVQALEEFPVLNREVLHVIADRIGQSAESAHASFLALTGLCTSMAKYGDSPASISDDLKTMKILTDEQATILTGMLERLREKAPAIHLFDRRNDAIYAGAPGLMRTSASVCIKPVLDERYQYDRQPVTKYEPKILGFVPVAQIEIVLDDAAGESRTQAFQLSEQALDRFLSDLVSLQREMREAKGSLKLS